VDTFEYIAVLVSIIVGLSVTHVLQAIGRVISRPDAQRLFWVHSVWVLATLVYLVFFWWFELGFRATEQWSAPLYAFVVAYAIVLYLMSVVVVPIEPEPDYREYFFSRRRWIYGFVFLTIPLDLVDTLLKPESAGLDLALGPIAVVILVAAGICVAGGISKNTWLHGVLAILWLMLNTLTLLSRAEPGL
jgi:hypothetical protein